MDKNNDILEAVILYKENPNNENKKKMEEKLYIIIASIIKRYEVENENNAYDRCWRLIVNFIDRIELRSYEEIISIVRKSINRVIAEIISEKDCTYIPVHMREVLEKYLAIKREKGLEEEVYPQDEEVAKIMNISLDKVKQIRKMVEKTVNTEKKH